MSETPYKLQIKIGSAEFTAEGPEETVKQAYDAFLKAITVPNIASATGSSSAKGIALGSGTLGISGQTPLVLALSAEEGAALDRAFKREGDVISLRHLPPTPNKIADAAIVLMYGYMKMTGN